MQSPAPGGQDPEAGVRLQVHWLLIREVPKVTYMSPGEFGCCSAVVRQEAEFSFSLYIEIVCNAQNPPLLPLTSHQCSPLALNEQPLLDPAAQELSSKIPPGYGGQMRMQAVNQQPS